ncbi:MAG: SRPBCC family protein [Pseudomonadota bacterium]
MKMVIQSLVAFCIGMAAAGAAETGLSVRQEGVQLVVEGWLKTHADADTAWAVLTDYPRFPEFVPGMLANRVLETAGGVTRLEQRGEVVSGAFRLVYAGQVRVVENPGKGLDIQFLSGPFKDTRGEWNVEGGKPLKLLYRMRMDLTRSPFPPPLAPAIAEQQVRTWVEVFGREMERQMDPREQQKRKAKPS